MIHDPWFEDGRTGDLAEAELRQAAYGMMVARRAMRGVLPEPLLSDLVLDMLLGLFVSGPAPRTLAELVDASVSATLARRWVDVLEGQRLIEFGPREPDGMSLALTAHGVARMTELLVRVIRSQREIHGWRQ